MWMLKKLTDLNLKYILMDLLNLLVDLMPIMKYFPSSEPQGSQDGYAHALFLFEKRTGRTE